MALIFGPDAFTVGSNINLEDCPSGSPDYTMLTGGAGAVTVPAANDWAQPAVAADLDGI